MASIYLPRSVISTPYTLELVLAFSTMDAVQNRLTRWRVT